MLLGQQLQWHTGAREIKVKKRQKIRTEHPKDMINTLYETVCSSSSSSNARQICLSLQCKPYECVSVLFIVFFVFGFIFFFACVFVSTSFCPCLSFIPQTYFFPLSSQHSDLLLLQYMHVFLTWLLLFDCLVSYEFLFSLLSAVFESIPFEINNYVRTLNGVHTVKSIHTGILCFVLCGIKYIMVYANRYKTKPNQVKQMMDVQRTLHVFTIYSCRFDCGSS